MRRALLLASMPLALAACQAADEPAEQPADEPTAEAADATIAEAALQLADGTPAGTARLHGTGDEVLLSLTLTGLAPGVHGMHLHTTGKCEGPKFESAGAHLNPGGHQHGSENPQGSHLGDLPNVTIDAAGGGTLDATLSDTREAVLAALFDADGSAIVVHADPDDYKTDPSGNSGDRIACGVVTRS